jgi:hypothetical protein
MEPREAWCPHCYHKVHPEALRCASCGTYFRGQFRRKPILTPPASVSLGTPEPSYNEDGFLELTGLAMSFNLPKPVTKGDADERTDGRLHDPGFPGA